VIRNLLVALAFAMYGWGPIFSKSDAGAIHFRDALRPEAVIALLVCNRVERGISPSWTSNSIQGGGNSPA
jgi:hypothetical protein